MHPRTGEILYTQVFHFSLVPEIDPILSNEIKLAGDLDYELELNILKEITNSWDTDTIKTISKKMHVKAGNSAILFKL